MTPLFAVVAALSGTALAKNGVADPYTFYDHGESTDDLYDIFDTFEAYTWHKYENSQHSSPDKKENLREFYLQSQADKEFKELLNLSFDVDIIYLNDKVKPTYDPALVYPDQVMPKDLNNSDGWTFNKDMSLVAANVFRQGYSLRTYNGVDMFPYRDDNVQKVINKFTFTTRANEVEFNLQFTVNAVNFNSRLNQDLQKKMKDSSYSSQIASAIKKDYVVSKRQYAFYILDCRQNEASMRALCNNNDIGKLQIQLNKDYPENLFMGILFDDTMTEKELVSEIDRLLRNQFTPPKEPSGQPSYRRTQDPNIDKKDLTPMFKRNLTTFVRYLHEDLAPKVSRLQGVFYKYKFESPLDFIMVKSDFKQFYESFTQARLSLLYSLELHKDSMFTLEWRQAETQLQMSRKLYKYFEDQVNEMARLLGEYHHIMEHDNLDCSEHRKGNKFVF